MRFVRLDVVERRLNMLSSRFREVAKREILQPNVFSQSGTTKSAIKNTTPSLIRRF
jgi:hypothetical protein